MKRKERENGFITFLCKSTFDILPVSFFIFSILSWAMSRYDWRCRQTRLSRKTQNKSNELKRRLLYPFSVNLKSNITTGISDKHCACQVPSGLLKRQRILYKGTLLAWENSPYFATPPLVSRQNDVWGTNKEIPYWWRETSQIRKGLCIGCS